jgi:hypothetical protein
MQSHFSTITAVFALTLASADYGPAQAAPIGGGTLANYIGNVTSAAGGGKIAYGNTYSECDARLNQLILGMQGAPKPLAVTPCHHTGYKRFKPWPLAVHLTPIFFEASTPRIALDKLRAIRGLREQHRIDVYEEAISKVVVAASE